MPEVSVIIPVYNGEKYIKNSINSVLNQTFKDFEIIIVNDASTDNTEKVIFENFNELINSGEIRYFKNEKNKERVYSRNLGLKEAKGSYIFYLDYDDIWVKDYIEKTIKIFDKYDVIYSYPRSFIDENGNMIRFSTKKISSLEKVIFSGNIGYPSATAIKKETNLLYKNDFLMREDWEIFIRAYLNGLKIALIDNNSVYIREHQNRTSKNNPNFYKATLKIYYEYKNKIREEYRHYFYFHISEIAFKFGDFKTGYNMLIKAIKQNPAILLDKRNLLTFLKRGFRIDRFFISK
ncbi:glycosyltransferase family 2 protein [Venenivibrio stagnispumantis]|uniref:Glycosyltransferase involved in cell wall bisynthesis n=1 Tax=Venenivibrio stagnispumantis TaxID=407998 RepID=A0AA46AEL0_9AQUI|nr:glycosyltransferase family 2 protein [Venenivibrio stagnispumantis]MCW4572863.1 glycosyltransferase family 2 protein [Venenivibrio stagnispumantis]SMP13080.1 Glycosyltransferase involved in cell wall bisynthesis [Venenivibrio stagnispumantis]